MLLTSLLKQQRRTRLARFVYLRMAISKWDESEISNALLHIVLLFKPLKLKMKNENLKCSQKERKKINKENISLGLQNPVMQFAIHNN